MQPYDAKLMMETLGTTLPFAILLIENDEDRQFLTEMYLQYKALMYKTAIDFFGEGNGEVEEAVGRFIERMCKYCHTFQAVTCDKRASYIVMSVGNVCRDRLREIMQQRNVLSHRESTPYVDGLRTTVLAGGSDWALFLSNVCLTRLYKTCIIAGAGKGRRANGRIGD